MKVLKFLPLILLLLLTGCSKEKYIICTSSINNKVENYSLVGNYKIYYKGDFVTSIKKDETYTSDDKKILDYFYEYKDLEYYDLSDKYGGVSYNIDYTDNSIKINSNINLKEVDINSMVKNGKIDKDYVISGKLTLNGLKRTYKDRGINCG